MRIIDTYRYKKVSRTGRMYEKVCEKPKIFPNGVFCKEKLKDCKDVALQQNVAYTTQIEKNVSHNLQKENTMLISDFEKQYKNYEQVIERIKQVNEFWIDVIVSSLKNFQK